MTRSHRRTHVADYFRIKRVRERTRDGTQLTMPEVNFMSQGNGYTAPQGRPRSSPPSTWMSDMIADHAALTATKVAEQPAVELEQKSKRRVSAEGRRARRKAVLKMRAKVERYAAKLNTSEPIAGSTWMTGPTYAKVTGRKAAFANFHHSPFPRKTYAWGRGIPIYAIPDKLLEKYTDDPDKVWVTIERAVQMFDCSVSTIHRRATQGGWQKRRAFGGRSTGIDLLIPAHLLPSTPPFASVGPVISPIINIAGSWMTYRQAAEHLGVSLKAVQWSAHRGQWKKRYPTPHGPLEVLVPGELPSPNLPNLPVIEPVALQPSLWSRFCQWVGW